MGEAVNNWDSVFTRIFSIPRGVVTVEDNVEDNDDDSDEDTQ